MSASPEPPAGVPSATKIVIRRVIDAPVERVFNAWLDPASIGRWLFTTPDGEMERVEIDPRVGGKFVVAERRGGVLAEHFGTYLEIERPRRLVFDFANGREAPPTTVTVEFRTVDGGCELTLSHELDPQWIDYAGRVRTGWMMILDVLADAVVTHSREIVSQRTFAAPAERVFAAFSDPAQLAKWWGPAGFANSIDEFDFRPGGMWRFVMHGPDGVDYKNESEFVEVAAPDRIVLVHLRPMHRFRMSMLHLPMGDRTTLIWRMAFDDVAECDRVKEFVVPANEQNFDRLAEHLKSQS